MKVIFTIEHFECGKKDYKEINITLNALPTDNKLILST